jgi:hypothetical protein
VYPVRRHPSSRSKRTAGRDPPAEDINPDDVGCVREESISRTREAGEGFTVVQRGSQRLQPWEEARTLQ